VETSIVQMSMFQSMSWQLYSIDPCWRGKIVFFTWSTKSCSISHNRTAWNFVCSECHQKDQEKNEICLAFISHAISQFCNKTTKRMNSSNLHRSSGYYNGYFSDHNFHSMLIVSRPSSSLFDDNQDRYK